MPTDLIMIMWKVTYLFPFLFLSILNRCVCYDFSLQVPNRAPHILRFPSQVTCERVLLRNSLELSNEMDTFKTTSSGLKYMDLIRGDGNYVGWLDDFESEKKFDSIYDRRKPLIFKVGTRQVIAGWDEALLTDMPVGTKRKVIIPSELGYGQRGAGGVIPPNSNLYFIIELEGVGAR